MIFGDQKILAIEIEPTFQNGKYFYGRCFAYAAGQRIGYADEIVVLDIAESRLNRSLNYVGHRAIPVNTNDMERLWSVLNANVWGVPENWEDFPERYGQIPAPHRFSVLDSDSFDGVVCFLVEKDDSDLFLWKEHDGDGVIHHVVLPLGYYQHLIEDVLKAPWKEGELPQS